MKLTRYQKLVIAILAFLQFTVVLDFMILSPLGAILLHELNVGTAQFGLVVSAYAFSAGASGLLAAGFADKFDRKKLLLFFYAGFVLGTLLCGLAPSYPFLLGARTVTGLFGGVIGSIAFAIIADLFPFEIRGRVMGIVMSAFAAAQVLGIPAGLYLANRWGWHSTFLMIAGVSAVVGVIIVTLLRPIDEHLKKPSQRNAFRHLLATVSRGRYLWGFGSTMLLAVGGFMLMPFGSAFCVNNMGISMQKLPLLYMFTGIAAMVAGPVMGRISDSVGKLATFAVGSTIGIALILYYTRLGVTPLWFAIGLNIFIFVAITARMISAQALTSAIPEPQDRGAFMSISSSLQQLAGGVASSSAGLIVTQNGDGPIEHYDRLGYVVSIAMFVTIVMMSKINRLVGAKPLSAAVAPAETARVEESAG
jgi:predicted MFS family arabinose efflux permease